MFTRQRQQSTTSVASPAGGGLAPAGSGGGGPAYNGQAAGYQQPPYSNYAYAQNSQVPMQYQQQLQHQFAQQHASQPVERQSSFTGLPPVRRTSTLQFDLSSIGQEKGKSTEEPSTAMAAQPTGAPSQQSAQQQQQQPQQQQQQQQQTGQHQPGAAPQGFAPNQVQQQPLQARQQLQQAQQQLQRQFSGPANFGAAQPGQPGQPGPGPGSPAQQRPPSWMFQPQQRQQPPQNNPYHSDPHFAPHQLQQQQQQQFTNSPTGFAQPQAYGQQGFAQQGPRFSQYQQPQQWNGQPAPQGFAIPSTVRQAPQQPGQQYVVNPQQQQQHGGFQQPAGVQQFLPKPGWTVEESHLVEPLASTRQRTSPAATPEQQSYSFDKETGLSSAESTTGQPNTIQRRLTEEEELTSPPSTLPPAQAQQLPPAAQQQSPVQSPQQATDTTSAGGNKAQTPGQASQGNPAQPQLGSPAPGPGPAASNFQPPGQVQQVPFHPQAPQQFQPVQHQPGFAGPGPAWAQPPPSSGGIAPSPAGGPGFDEKGGSRLSKITSWRMSAVGTPPASSHSAQPPKHALAGSGISPSPLQQEQQPQPQPQQQPQAHPQPQKEATGKKLRDFLSFGKGNKSQQQQPGQQQQGQNPPLPPAQLYPHQYSHQYPQQAISQQGPGQGFPQGFQGGPQGYQGPPQNFQVPPHSRQGTPQALQGAQNTPPQPSPQGSPPGAVQGVAENVLALDAQGRPTPPLQASSQAANSPPQPFPSPAPSTRQQNPTNVQGLGPQGQTSVALPRPSLADGQAQTATSPPPAQTARQAPSLVQGQAPTPTPSQTSAATSLANQPNVQKEQEATAETASDGQQGGLRRSFSYNRSRPPAPSEGPSAQEPPNGFQAPRALQSFGPPGSAQVAPAQQRQQAPQQFQPQQSQQPPFQQQQFQQAPQPQLQQQQQQQQQQQDQLQGPLHPPGFFNRTNTFGSIVPQDSERSGQRGSKLLSGIFGKAKGKDKSKADGAQGTSGGGQAGPQYPPGVGPPSTLGPLQHVPTGFTPNNSGNSPYFNPQQVGGPAPPAGQGRGSFAIPGGRPRGASNASFGSAQPQQPSPSQGGGPVAGQLQTQTPPGRPPVTDANVQTPVSAPSPVSITNERPERPLYGATQTTQDRVGPFAPVYSSSGYDARGHPAQDRVGPLPATGGPAVPDSKELGPSSPVRSMQSPSPLSSSSAGPPSARSGRPNVENIVTNPVGPVPTARGRIPSAQTSSPLARKPVITASSTQPSAQQPHQQQQQQPPPPQGTPQQTTQLATGGVPAASGPQNEPLPRPPGIGQSNGRPSSIVSNITINGANDANGAQHSPSVTTPVAGFRSASPAVSTSSYQPPVSSSGATISPTPPPQQDSQQRVLQEAGQDGGKTVQFQGIQPGQAGPFGQPGEVAAFPIHGPGGYQQGAIGNQAGSAPATQQKPDKEKGITKKLFGRFRTNKTAADPAGPPPGGPQYPPGLVPAPLHIRRQSASGNVLPDAPHGPASSIGEKAPSGVLPGQPLQGPHQMYQDQRRTQFPGQVLPNAIPQQPSAAIYPPAPNREQALQQQVSPTERRQQQQMLPQQPQPGPAPQQQPQQQPSQSRPQAPQHQGGHLGSFFSSRHKPQQQPQQPQQRPQQQQAPQQQLQQQQQQQQRNAEPQYSVVPIPGGYAPVHGEGSVAPSHYNLGRGASFQSQQHLQPHSNFHPQRQGPRDPATNPQQFQQQQPQAQQQQPQQPFQQQRQLQQQQPQQEQPQRQQWTPTGLQPLQASFQDQSQVVPGQTAALSAAPPVAPASGQAAPNQATGDVTKPQTAQHPLQQHPVAFTVPPPPPAISSFASEHGNDSDSFVPGAVSAPLQPTPSPPLPSLPAQQQQGDERQQQETKPGAEAKLEIQPQVNHGLRREGIVAQQQVKAETPVSSLHASPQPSQVQLHENTEITASETASESAPTPAAVSAPAPAPARLPQGPPPSSKATQLEPIATAAANEHVPDEEDIYNATPLHPAKNVEEHTVLGGASASPASLATPSSSAAQPASIVSTAPVVSVAPVAATPVVSPPPLEPAAATAESAARVGPAAGPVQRAPSTADIMSPITQTGSAEPDVHSITPPSPVDDFDFTHPAMAPSATGGLSIPGIGGTGSGSATTNGVNGESVGRQKTIRQTPAQQYEEYKRRQMQKDLEEKIPVFVPEPDQELAAQKQREQDEPLMSATSYPGQEWNPYEEFAYEED